MDSGSSFNDKTICWNFSWRPPPRWRCPPRRVSSSKKVSFDREQSAAQCACVSKSQSREQMFSSNCPGAVGAAHVNRQLLEHVDYLEVALRFTLRILLIAVDARNAHQSHASKCRSCDVDNSAPLAVKGEPSPHQHPVQRGQGGTGRCHGLSETSSHAFHPSLEEQKRCFVAV